MKNLHHRLVSGLILTIAVLSILGCTTASAAAASGSESPSAAFQESVAGLTAADLSDEEIEGLLWMREEEKLARDVYLELYAQWNLSIFQNIANSEQAHTDSVKALLDQFGLADPMQTDTHGVFENPDLQALYDQLVSQGSQSLQAALEVGAAIEEIDILDLEENIAQTSNSAIRLVYENLLKGSRNHLRAFVTTLGQQTGEAYQPQYLSAEAYDAIVSTPSESGGRGQSGQTSQSGQSRGGKGNGKGRGNR